MIVTARISPRMIDGEFTVLLLGDVVADVGEQVTIYNHPQGAFVEGFTVLANESFFLERAPLDLLYKFGFPTHQDLRRYFEAEYGVDLPQKVPITILTLSDEA